jgi:hypothetical protein
MIIPNIIHTDHIREKPAVTTVSEFRVNDVSAEFGLSTFGVHLSNLQPLSGVAAIFIVVPGG